MSTRNSSAAAAAAKPKSKSKPKGASSAKPEPKPKGKALKRTASVAQPLDLKQGDHVQLTKNRAFETPGAVYLLIQKIEGGRALLQSVVTGERGFLTAKIDNLQVVPSSNSSLAFRYAKARAAEAEYNRISSDASNAALLAIDIDSGSDSDNEEEVQAADAKRQRVDNVSTACVDNVSTACIHPEKSIRSISVQGMVEKVHCSHCNETFERITESGIQHVELYNPGRVCLHGDPAWDEVKRSWYCEDCGSDDVPPPTPDPSRSAEPKGEEEEEDKEDEQPIHIHTPATRQASFFPRPRFNKGHPAFLPQNDQLHYLAVLLGEDEVYVFKDTPEGLDQARAKMHKLASECVGGDIDIVRQKLGEQPRTAKSIVEANYMLAPDTGDEFA